jgi:hypothetical protein
MRFIIQDGTPYLISGGRAFPVEITEKKEVVIDKENGSMSDETGYLTLDEVIAKIAYTKKQDEPQEEKKGRRKSNLS